MQGVVVRSVYLCSLVGFSKDWLHPEEPHFLLIAEVFLDSLLVVIPGCKNVIIIILNGSTKFVLNNHKMSLKVMNRPFRKA